MTRTKDIRSSFLDHFGKAGHRTVPSAPLVPDTDPTLMFVNAGMVPFKNIFTGLAQVDYTTATSVQKCVRAGGKHNDLDNVGHTLRHHTFFEMLGNFSFGDYFKEEAIVQAWSLLHREWGLLADRLVVTVYHSDDEAYGLWRKISGLPTDRIIRIASDDNFWSMGKTGPCGPSSEIFYDHGSHIAGGMPGSIDADGDRFVEIWNLVFMQYEQLDSGERVRLPRPSIDTGMGLERIAAVLQGVPDNFDIDLFKALIAASIEHSGVAAVGAAHSSHRVIADHLRSSAFLIADGVLPSNDGRGYVLRRIMRRAMRHVHMLGVDMPLMHRLLPALIVEMGAAYPELVRARALIAETLEREEKRFRQTLDKGLHLLAESTATMARGAALSGDIAFKLYDTYGFPYDLTADALRMQGLVVDRTGFDVAMAQQKARARAAWKGSGAKATEEIWFDLAQTCGATEFIGYDRTESESVILALVHDGESVLSADIGGTIDVLVKETVFYGESGGQIGDSGRLVTQDGGVAIVSGTSKMLGKLHVHHGQITKGCLRVGDRLRLSIDAARRKRLRANHSATHLLHAALRSRLGAHVVQKGSLVADDRLRFDFSHPGGLMKEEIAAIESDVNAHIRGNHAVDTRLMGYEDAIALGAVALFGEKYDDEVRVLSMGDGECGERDTVDPPRDPPHAPAPRPPYSVELCGGTHVYALGDIGLFHIISEGAVASGVRRIEAVTGEAAHVWLATRDAALQAAAAVLKVQATDVPERVAVLAKALKHAERELAAAKKKLALGGGDATGARAMEAVENIAGTAFLAQRLEDFTTKDMRGAAEDLLKKLGSGVAMVVAVNDGRAAVAITVSPDCVSRFTAVDLVTVAVATLGGKGGGGRATLAQGGGPDGNKAVDSIAAVRAALSKISTS